MSWNEWTSVGKQYIQQSPPPTPDAQTNSVLFDVSFKYAPNIQTRAALLMFLSLCVCVCLWFYQETQRLLAEPVPGIKAEPDEGNARYFHVVIAGPQDSPFEGGTFKLELFLPEEYPMAAPKVRFMTKIYHPNVDKLGRICLDILKGKRALCLSM